VPVLSVRTRLGRRAVSDETNDWDALQAHLIGASKPRASLVGNVTRHVKAGLVTSFGETYLPREGAHTTAKKTATPGIPVGSLTVPVVIGPDCAPLPPESAPAARFEAELASMRAVRIKEDATAVHPIILVTKYYRDQLASGKLTGSKLVGSHCDKHRRRKCLLRINSMEEFNRPDGTKGERLVWNFGAFCTTSLSTSTTDPWHSRMQSVSSPIKTARVGFGTQR